MTNQSNSTKSRGSGVNSEVKKVDQPQFDPNLGPTRKLLEISVIFYSNLMLRALILSDHQKWSSPE